MAKATRPVISPEDLRKIEETGKAAKDPYVLAKTAVEMMKTGGEAAGSQLYLQALNALKLTVVADRFMRLPVQTKVGGHVPWQRAAETYESNLATLDGMCPQGAAAIRKAAAENLKNYELHSTKEGNYQILDLQKPIPEGWLGSPEGRLVNHKAVAEAWTFDRAKTPLPHPILFDGVSFGWALFRVLQTTRQSYQGYSCAIYIIESDPLAMAMFLHMHDLRSLIADPRVRWFVNASPALVTEDFRRSLESNPLWSLPRRVVRGRLRARPEIAVEPVLQEIVNRREHHRNDLHAKIRENYSGKTPAAWRERYAAALTPQSAEPLRVLGIVGRYAPAARVAMDSLAGAVQRAGGRVEMALEPDDYSLENPFVERIAEFKPDLIVQCSRMRHQNPHLPRNVPFLSWDLENTPQMRSAQATADVIDPIYGPMHFVAGPAALHGFVNLDWPARCAILCHAAASTEHLKPRAATAAEMAACGCDFSFIADAGGMPSAIRDAQLARLGGAIGPVFGSLSEVLLANSTDDRGIPWTQGKLRGMAARIAMDKKVQLSAGDIERVAAAGMMVADRVFRHEGLAWVADFCRESGKSLRLYGAGWDKHPAFAPYAAGPMRDQSHLFAITLASRINLQIQPAGILNTHLLEGIAAGGFYMFRKTLHDQGDRNILLAMETAARHIWEQRVERFADLDALGEGPVAAAWRLVGENYRAQQRQSGASEKSILRGASAAARLRHPLLLLPGLMEVSFETPAHLARRAAALLADEELRHGIAADLRNSINEHFSYDARWRTFAEHILGSLESSGDPSA